jgi:Spy/CpxP family protein refolding chaperone
MHHTDRFTVKLNILYYKGGTMKADHSQQTKTNRVFFGMILCMSLFFMTAQVQAKDMPMGKWWQRPKMAAALNLTSDDKHALDNLYAQNHNILSALTSSLKKEHLKLEVILEGNPVDQTALHDQFIQVEAVKQNLDNAHLQYMLGVRNILGPDRFKQLSEMSQDMRSKRHGRAGHRERSKN